MLFENTEDRFDQLSPAPAGPFCFVSGHQCTVAPQYFVVRTSAYTSSIQPNTQQRAGMAFLTSAALTPGSSIDSVAAATTCSTSSLVGPGSGSDPIALLTAS